MDSVDFRHLLIAFLVTERGFVPYDDERITFETDIRFADDAFLDRLVIADLGIDPTNGIMHRYAIPSTPRAKKAD
jgi:hypothetical protein